MKEIGIAKTFLNRIRQWPGMPVLLPVVLSLLLLLAGAAASFGAVEIKSIEVNQVLGVQKDSHQYYVAGKHTIVSAVLSEAAIIKSTDSVTVTPSVGQSFTMSPKAPGVSTSTVDFVCDSLAACKNWAVGTYTFNVSVNGTTKNFPGPYTFESGDPLRILAVPVKANYGTKGIKSVAVGTWEKLNRFTQQVYPLGEGKLVWTNRTAGLDGSAAKYDLEKSKGPGDLNLAKELGKLIPSSCKTSPKAVGCYDWVIGFIKEAPVQDDGQSMAGFTFGGYRSVVVVAGDQDAQATVAHEIAHKYGIGDTYNDADSSSIRCSVNPAPDGFKGLNWDNNRVAFPGCTAGRPASTLEDSSGNLANGAQVPASAHPYEVGGRGLLQEMVDFMAASGRVPLQSQIWITPDVYDWLFLRMVKNQPDTPKSTTSVITRLAMDAGPQRFLSFSGSLSKSDIVALDPWKSYTDTADLADTSGALMIRALDGSGNAVASSSFDVEFFTVHPARTIDPAPFTGVVRFPSGTVKFQIVKNGIVLTEVPVSANQPTVSDVSPTSPVTLGGPYTITWTSNDPDGGTLTYTVEYNPDVTNPDSPWMILVDDLETASWDEDFSLLPGGAHAQIRVTASDGVLTASAESSQFTVPVQKPDVFIDDLPWGTTYLAGSPVLFVGSAYDLQDEWLADSRLAWTSNISGALGYGSELMVNDLKTGTHTVTLTATNSAGLTASSTVDVVVQPAQPVSDGGSSKNCFIATAAFGSYLHPAVAILRSFRDFFLMTNTPGQIFVAWYYRVSPPIANMIRTSEIMKSGVRIALLPVVGISYLSLTIGAMPTLLMLLLFMAFAWLGLRSLGRRRQTR